MEKNLSRSPRDGRGQRFERESRPEFIRYANFFFLIFTFTFDSYILHTSSAAQELALKPKSLDISSSSHCPRQRSFETIDGIYSQAPSSKDRVISLVNLCISKCSSNLHKIKSVDDAPSPEIAVKILQAANPSLLRKIENNSPVEKISFLNCLLLKVYSFLFALLN